MAGRLTLRHLTKDEEKRFRRDWSVFRYPPIKINEEGWFTPNIFKHFADRLYNFKVKPTDVFVVTFPKSGTTWMQEIVWSLLYNPNLDNPEGDLLLDFRSPCFEQFSFFAQPDPASAGMDFSEYLKDVPSNKRFSEEMVLLWAKTLESPRVLKSHLPFALLPPKTLYDSKVIYVARDPRDVIYSYYHFSKLHDLFGYTGTLEDFLDDFLNGEVLYAPYWSHIKQAWEKRDLPNFCFVFYEDLKIDLASGVKRIDKFLGTNRTDKQIQKIAHHTSFEQMKERAKGNQPTSLNSQYFNEEVMKEGGGFFRKGEVGDWKKRFTPEQMKRINDWMANNLRIFGDNCLFRI